MTTVVVSPHSAQSTNSKSSCSSSSSSSSSATSTPRTRNKDTPYLPSYLEPGALCVVCEDAATGLHYKAITCEGCKGFFRRTIQRGIDYGACRATTTNEGVVGACPINKDTRNGCQHCRLQKCLQQGMSTALVLSETERAQKRALIRENRERRALEAVAVKRREAADTLRSSKDLVHSMATAFYRHVEGDDQVVQWIVALTPRLQAFADGTQLNALKSMTASPLSLLLVQLMRVICCFDSYSSTFIGTDKTFGKADFGGSPERDDDDDEDCNVVDDEEPRTNSLADRLFSLASIFGSLECDRRELAVTLVWLLAIDLESSSDDSSRLLRILRALSDASTDLEDTAIETDRRWARLIGALVELRLLAGHLADILLELPSATSKLQGASTSSFLSALFRF